VRRALERFGFYWRRSGGRLTQASTDLVTDVLKEQLARVTSWEEFINARLVLDVEGAIPEGERRALDALPDSVHIYGDRVPVDYEIESGGGVARLRLKEGQARRLQPRDLPPLDRPIRFTVLRGKREAVRADSLDDLRRQLSGLSRGERQRLARAGGGRGGRGSRGGRGGGGGPGKGWRR
jgi:ATP-dependent helicase HrpA